MQNIKEISDTLRGPKVNARRHWDGETKTGFWKMPKLENLY